MEASQVNLIRVDDTTSNLNAYAFNIFTFNTCAPSFAVILARIVRKSQQRTLTHDVYKIEVKRAYKVSAIRPVTSDRWVSINHILGCEQMSPDAQHLLRDGRLMTPSMDSMCGGLNLKVGKLYMIAASTQHIGICNYVKEYSQMSIVERRGFAGGYKKGCDCKVSIDREPISAADALLMDQLSLVRRSSSCSRWKDTTTRSALAPGSRSRSARRTSAPVCRRAAPSPPTANRSSATGATASPTRRAATLN